MSGRKRGVRYWVSWSGVCAVAALFVAADAIAQACERRHRTRAATQVDDDTEF